MSSVKVYRTVAMCVILEKLYPAHACVSPKGSTSQPSQASTRMESRAFSLIMKVARAGTSPGCTGNTDPSTTRRFRTLK